MKIEEILLLSLFRWYDSERFSWAIIVDFIMNITMAVRLFEGQNVN